MQQQQQQQCLGCLAYARPNLLPTPNLRPPSCSNESVLCLKDPSRPFPTGAPLGVLKWRLQVGLPPCRPG